jgi:hypothetical protein
VSAGAGEETLNPKKAKKSEKIYESGIETLIRREAVKSNATKVVP